MAFVTEKSELKPGLILFRRGDVGHRMWYCRMKMPKADRYKTVSLKTTDIDAAKEKAFDQDADIRFRLKHDVPVFNRPFRDVAREYLLTQEARAKRGEISTARPKKLRAVIEGTLDRYAGSTQVHLIGDERWGSYARAKEIDARNNLLTVVRADGTERTYNPSRQQGVSVYREEPRSLSVGDRVQFTAPANDLKVANRELGTIESIGRDGRLSLRMDGGREVALDPRQHPHLDHGYAVTSHSSQGQTAERVLINVDTELGARDLLNSRMAYVSVSRGAHDAQLFTNDREKLPAALGHEVSHESAHVPAHKPEQSIAPQQEIGPRHEQGPGLGIGF